MATTKHLTLSDVDRLADHLAYHFAQVRKLVEGCGAPQLKASDDAVHITRTATEADCLRRLDALDGERYELFARLHEASEHMNEYALFSGGELGDTAIGEDGLEEMTAKAEALHAEGTADSGRAARWPNRKIVLPEDEHMQASALIERAKRLAAIGYDRGASGASLTLFETIEDILTRAEQLVDGAKVQS